MGISVVPGTGVHTVMVPTGNRIPFIHQPVIRNSKRQSANDVKKLYAMTSVIMCNRPGAENDDEWRNDHQNNTFSFLFRLTDFFTQINKRHYTRLLLLTVSYSE